MGQVQKRTQQKKVFHRDGLNKNKTKQKKTGGKDRKSSFGSKLGKFYSTRRHQRAGLDESAYCECR